MASRSLTDTLRETLAVFDDPGEPRTTPEVAEQLDLGRRSTYARLERLVEEGRLETKKVGANARVWWRPPTNADAIDPDWSAAADSLIDDVLDDVDVGIFVLDENFDIVWINKTTERYFGLDREEVVGRDKRRVIDEHVASVVEDGRAFAETVLATYDDNTYAERFECRVQTDSGRWLEHRSEPIESGEYAGGRVELYYDVTDRKRSERERREDREQFESLIDAVEEYAIFTLDTEGYVQTWNPGVERIKGYEADEIRGEHFSRFYTDEAVEAGVPEDNLAEAAKRGSIEDEGWRVRADGSQFWANVTITAIRDDDGNLEGYAKVTRDMTQRREYEQRLEAKTRELAGELDEVFDRISDGFFAIDERLQYLYVNDYAADMLGLDDSVAGSHIEDVNVLPEQFVQALHEAFETQESVTFETYDDSLDRWFDSTVYPSESGLSVYFHDVTERKRRQQELVQYERIVETVDDGVYVVDADHRFAMVNDAFVSMTGYDRKELLGTHAELVFGEKFVDTADEKQEALESGDLDVAVIEEELYRADDTSFPVESRFNIFDFNDGEQGRVGVVRDVTERIEREKELELYETIVETIDDGIYVLDEEYRFTEVNNAYVEMTGYDRDELLGTHCSLVVDDEVSTESASLVERLASGDIDVASLEADIHRADGSRLRAESNFAALSPESSGGLRKVGVVRDVSDRVERERALEKQVRQQEAIAELGQSALEETDVDQLMAEAAELVADTLDNDYCKVLDYEPGAERLLLRQGVGWDDGIVGSASVSAVEADSQAAYTLASEEPVVVEELEADPRIDGPDLLIDHGVESGISVVIGPHDDPWGILGTHDTARNEFAEQDVNFVWSVANILATAIDRRERERRLRRQRQELTALNSLNETVSEITNAVIDQSTREEIETTACERLAASDSYLLAWIGEADPTSQTMTLRTESGVEGYLDETTISIDPNDDRSEGPTGKAIRTGEMQTTRDVLNDPKYEPWREAAIEHGFRSSAAIPIVHKDTIYGVLNVYAERPHAFEGQEREVVADLGEIIGHAIAAAERKRALMSDDLVELEFRIQDVFEALGARVETEGTITLDYAVPIVDDEFLVYGTASPDAIDTVVDLVDVIPYWEEVTVRSEGDSVSFELRLADPPVLSVIASLGGYVERAIIEDGNYQMTVHLAPSVDVRRVIDAVEEAYPEAELLRHKQITLLRDEPQRLQQHLVADLTDRQRAALDAAYRAGFFEWPRAISGEEVAESLDVAPSTFHQHLRKAERKVFDSLFSTGGQMDG